MADNKTNTPNPNGIALYNAIKGEDCPITFAELANKAGIEAKTGYLTAARKLARADGFDIVKLDKAVTARMTSVTEYPSGLRIEKSKDLVMDGYVLAPYKAE